MELHQAIDTLRAALNAGHFADHRVDFPANLVAQYTKRGSLSEKQTYWAHKLADEIKNPPPPPEGVKVSQTFAGVLALFNKAVADKLQYPQITLLLNDGQPVRISRAADYSKNPGHVYVKLYETVGYAGKVAPDGKFFPKTGLDADLIEELCELLARLGNDPVGVATEYAKLTGRCCFCDIALDNEKSVAVGYGPVCAKHYGLPYGAAARDEANAKKEVVLPNKAPLSLDEMVRA